MQPGDYIQPNLVIEENDNKPNLKERHYIVTDVRENGDVQAFYSAGPNKAFYGCPFTFTKDELKNFQKIH